MSPQERYDNEQQQVLQDLEQELYLDQLARDFIWALEQYELEVELDPEDLV